MDLDTATGNGGTAGGLSTPTAPGTDGHLLSPQGPFAGVAKVLNRIIYNSLRELDNPFITKRGRTSYFRVVKRRTN